MIKTKNLIIRPLNEAMATREDILTLLAYVQVPNDDHVTEHPDLIDAVSRVSKEFDICLVDEHGVDEDIIDYEIGYAVLVEDAFFKAEQAAIEKYM